MELKTAWKLRTLCFHFCRLVDSRWNATLMYGLQASKSEKANALASKKIDLKDAEKERFHVDRHSPRRELS